MWETLTDASRTNTTAVVREAKYFRSARTAPHGASAPPQTRDASANAPRLPSRPTCSKTWIPPDSVHSDDTVFHVDEKRDPFQAGIDA